jgi:hypothetical protein
MLVCRAVLVVVMHARSCIFCRTCTHTQGPGKSAAAKVLNFEKLVLIPLVLVLLRVRSSPFLPAIGCCGAAARWSSSHPWLRPMHLRMLAPAHATAQLAAVSDT